MRRLSSMAVPVALALLCAQPVLAGGLPIAGPGAPAPQTVVSWGGQTWVVEPPGTTGSSGQSKSNLASAVWVDDAGHLHLRIEKAAGQWAMPELTSANQLGYGTYRWTVATPLGSLDRNAVLGLFALNPQYSSKKTHEIDIEDIGEHRTASTNYAQYVVQPYWAPNHLKRYGAKSTWHPITQQFRWTAGRVTFTSWYGTKLTRQHLLSTWTFTGPDVPPSSGVSAYMDLWLATPRSAPAPSTGQPVEVVLDSFAFTPAG